MKVNKKVMAELVKNFQRNRNTVTMRYDDFIADMKNAKTVEEVMRLKKLFLCELVMDIPLCSSECYFCIYHDEKCFNCLYAKKHGVCGKTQEHTRQKKKLPTWDKIRNIRNHLEETIDKEYFREGENYGD